MKSFLYILLYLMAAIGFGMILALSSRMHPFLAIPTIVIAIFGLALFQVWIETR